MHAVHQELTTGEATQEAPNRVQGEESAWVLGLLAVLALARAPSLLISPRFWAEDGTVYFAYARSHGLLESLFLVPTTSGPAGYLNLAANLPAWIAAHFVPLEWAPLVPTIFALVIQLLPAWLVLQGRLPAFPCPFQRRLAALVMIVSPPLLSEVWGNATNSQVFLGLAASLILAESTEDWTSRDFGLRLGILALASLSGPYTIFLAPLFLFRAFHRAVPFQRPAAEPTEGPLARSRTRRLALLITTAALFQGAAYAWTIQAVGLADRSLGGGPLGARLAAILHADLLQGLLGEQGGTAVASVLGLLKAIERLSAEGLADAHLRSAGWLSLGLLLAVAGALAAGAATGARSRRTSRSYRLLAMMPALSALWISLAVGLAVGPLVTVERYSVLPGLLWLLAAIAAIHDPRSFLRRWACRWVLVFALGLGALGYFQEVPASSLGLVEGRPDWSREVARWRQDSVRLLSIWPYSDPAPWFLYLEPAAADADSARITIQRLPRPANLVSTGGWQGHAWAVDGLGDDFKMVIGFRASAPSTALRFQLRFENGDGQALAVLRPGAFAAERVVRWTVERHDRRLIDVPMDRVRRVTLALKPEEERPTRVLVQDLYIGPRIEGALEPLLPSRWPTSARPGGLSRGWILPGLLALLLLAWLMAGNPCEPSARRRLLPPLLFLGASAFCLRLAQPGPEPFLALLLFWPLASWIRGDLTHHSMAEGDTEADDAKAPAKPWRTLRLLAMTLSLGSAGLGLGTELGLGWPNPGSIPAGDWADRAWQLGFGPEGWLGLFPLVFVALFRTLQRPSADGRRAALLAALLLANAVIFVLDPNNFSRRVLLASLYPLFWLLLDPSVETDRAPGADRIWRWVRVGGLLVFLVYTLPSLERAEKPPATLELRSLGESRMAPSAPLLSRDDEPGDVEEDLP